MPQPLFQRTPLLDGDDINLKREEIRSYFHTTLDRYEQLFETLRTDEAYYKKSISLRHPLIFYLGHTATFFVNKLILAGLISERINPRLESIFAVGVDEMSWDDLDSTHYDSDSRRSTRLSQCQARRVDKLITAMLLALLITWESSCHCDGYEHERIHLKTSSVLIRQHALHFVQPHPDWQPCRKSGAAPQNHWCRLPLERLHCIKPNQSAALRLG